MALEAVQAQAGHRSIESTRIYLHLTDDWLADEYQRAAALIDADNADLIDPSDATSMKPLWNPPPIRGPSRRSPPEWASHRRQSPGLVETMARYLAQRPVLAPASVDSAA